MSELDPESYMQPRNGQSDSDVVSNAFQRGQS